MREVRHHCKLRLFDSRFPVRLIAGATPDIEVKCPRCSRKEGKSVFAGFRIETPRWIQPVPADPLHCANPQCYTRIADLSLPYVLVQEDEDVSFRCVKCKRKTRLRLGGVADAA